MPGTKIKAQGSGLLKRGWLENPRTIYGGYKRTIIELNGYFPWPRLITGWYVMTTFW